MREDRPVDFADGVLKPWEVVSFEIPHDNGPKIIDHFQIDHSLQLEWQPVTKLVIEDGLTHRLYRLPDNMKMPINAHGSDLVLESVADPCEVNDVNSA